MSIAQVLSGDPSAQTIIGARAVGRDAFPDLAKAYTIAMPVKTNRAGLTTCGLGLSRLRLRLSGSFPASIALFVFIEKVPPSGGKSLHSLRNIVSAQVRVALFDASIILACEVISSYQEGRHRRFSYRSICER